MCRHDRMLHPVAEGDAAIRELLATTSFVSADGSPYVPDNLYVFDPEGDEDCDLDAGDELKARP